MLKLHRAFLQQQYFLYHHTIADDGKMSAAAQFYVGEDRFTVRKKIAKDLEEMGQISKIVDIFFLFNFFSANLT